MQQTMPGPVHHRASQLAPWVFLFALMAIAIAVSLATFALPSVGSFPFP